MDTTRASLLNRIVDRQDKAAWVEFYKLHKPLLHKFAKSRGLPDELADDIVQQCMIAVHRHIDGFKYDPNRGQFKSWLRTMAANQVKNAFRAKLEQIAESADFKRQQEREESPEDAFNRIWMREHLRHCLRIIRKDLDKTTYDAFDRYAMQGENAEVVCHDLKISANQLYKIKWRITQRLSQELNKLLGDRQD